MEYPFIAITPRSTLIWRGSTWKSPIYGSNKTVRHLNTEQTNNLDWIKLSEIELFDHLTVCKQMINIIINY